MRAVALALACGLALQASAASAGSVLIEQGVTTDGTADVSIEPPFGAFARYRLTVISDASLTYAASLRWFRMDQIGWADGPPYAPPGGGWFYDYYLDRFIDCGGFAATGATCSNDLLWDPRQLTTMSFDDNVLQVVAERPVEFHSPIIPGEDYESFNGETKVELFLFWDGPGPVNYRVYAAEIPEPAAWALMIAGFGLAGAEMRGRRRNVVAA
jgi:hypothetical protein